MADKRNELAPIIIKKKKVVKGGGHHGGAWKVATFGAPFQIGAFAPMTCPPNCIRRDERRSDVCGDCEPPRHPLSDAGATIDAKC